MVVFLSVALLAVGPVAVPTPAATPRPTQVAERSADPRDKMICKRFLETGSLVRGYRTCKTKGEWERERDNIRAAGGGGDSCRNRGNGGGC